VTDTDTVIEGDTRRDSESGTGLQSEPRGQELGSQWGSHVVQRGHLIGALPGPLGQTQPACVLHLILILIRVAKLVVIVKLLVTMRAEWEGRGGGEGGRGRGREDVGRWGGAGRSSAGGRSPQTSSSLGCNRSSTTLTPRTPRAAAAAAPPLLCLVVLCPRTPTPPLGGADGDVSSAHASGSPWGPSHLPALGGLTSLPPGRGAPGASGTQGAPRTRVPYTGGVHPRWQPGIAR